MEHNDVIENSILIYESDDNIKVEVVLEEENVWLTQEQIGKLYNKAKSTINEHIKNIFDEKELDKDAVVRKFRTTAKDGKSYNVNYYNLDMIIAIGFRVKSSQGTKFRIISNERLLSKGINIRTFFSKALFKVKNYITDNCFNFTHLFVTNMLNKQKITRIVANYFFITIHEKYKSKIFSIIGFICISFTLILISNFTPLKVLSIILMNVVFCMFVPFDNHIKE